MIPVARGSLSGSIMLCIWPTISYVKRPTAVLLLYNASFLLLQSYFEVLSTLLLFIFLNDGGNTIQVSWLLLEQN